MSTHKNIEKICVIVIIFSILLTALFMNGNSLGINVISSEKGYESRLFDTSKVHTINIVMDDWDDFIENCTNEEYVNCSVIIDNQSYKNVGIRAKGNTSMTQVKNYDNNRYSFKLEFDHYDDAKNYYGLDKLSLNNIIQDNTYMKDYLCYQMMKEAGANAPLTSFVQIFVNGEEWGLYLAVESIEDAFLERTYGSDYGNLYKPDSQSMGGGIGNGRNFEQETSNDQNNTDDVKNEQKENMQPPDRIIDDSGEGDNSQEQTENPFNRPNGEMKGFGNDSIKGSDDVLLSYTDDNYESYKNIFDNAKTDISNSDKDTLINSLKNLKEGSNIENIVDVPAVIKYFVAHNFVCNFDSYTGSMVHNYYLYEDGGQLSMLPWDYNLAFGGFQGAQNATGLVNYPIDTPISGGTIEQRPMLSWIFNSEEYTELYHKYFSEFIKNYFESGKFDQEIERVENLIAPYVESDPTKFCTYEEFEKGVETLKTFCNLRAESVKQQLEGTIASTSDGQQTDNTNLVDASSISISDMGSMMGQGMGGDKPGRMDEVQNSNSQNESTSDQDENKIQNGQEGMTPPNGQEGMTPPNGQEAMAPPNGQEDVTSQSSKSQTENMNQNMENISDTSSEMENKENSNSDTNMESSHHMEMPMEEMGKQPGMNQGNYLQQIILIGMSIVFLVVALVSVIRYKKIKS